MNEVVEKIFSPPIPEFLGNVLEKDYFDSELFPYTVKGHGYAIDIINGDIVACYEIKQACKRYLEDLKKSELKDNEYFFDAERSERFLRIAQKFKHVKGNWDKDFIIFEPWQCFLGVNIFGFVDKETNSRRFRTAYVEVARGNAKSTKASILGLYFLCLEDPNGNEVYSAATKKDQARIILDSARAMAKGNKSYRDRFGVNVMKHHIEHESSNSFFKALSSDSDSLDGLQPVLGLVDELHAHKTREIYDVIDSAMSKRNDSLMFVITTAGFNTNGIGHSESQYAKKLLRGETQNDQFFALVYTLDENDDPYEESNWIKANPNLGVSVDIKNLKAKARKAQDDPESENNFLVKHLNVWTNATNPFFNIKKWDILKNFGVVRLEDFYGEDCVAAIDLASKIDLTSKAFVFHPDDNYYIFLRNYIPEARLSDRTNRNRDLYRSWVKQNWLIATPGEAINYNKIQEEFLRLLDNFNIYECMFDPWNAAQFAQGLIADGIPMTEFRMNTGNLSEPMKMLGASILDQKIRHEDSPLVRWSMSNVVAKRDANDNVFPRKDHEELKIDPAISIIMAFAGWVKKIQEKSIYEERGIIVL